MPEKVFTFVCAECRQQTPESRDCAWGARSQRFCPACAVKRETFKRDHYELFCYAAVKLPESVRGRLVTSASGGVETALPLPGSEIDDERLFRLRRFCGRASKGDVFTPKHLVEFLALAQARRKHFVELASAESIATVVDPDNEIGRYLVSVRSGNIEDCDVIIEAVERALAVARSYEPLPPSGYDL